MFSWETVVKRRLVFVFLAAVLAGNIAYAGGGSSAATAPASHEPVATTTPRPTASVSPTPQPQQSVVTEQAAQKPVVATAKATQAPIKGDNLSIATLGFQAPVVPVGLTSSNAIDVPAGPQVGYWNGSSRPGTPGAVFLDGHVDGVFARLHKVSAGQTIQLSYGGTSYSYVIVHKEIVQLAGIDMNRALSVYGSALEGLNIMTCAGKYIPSQGTYDQRLVIYATRI